MTARLRLLAAVLLIGLPPATAATTQPAATVAQSDLGWLVGTWRGEGIRMGRTYDAVLEVRPALGGRFLEFSYRSGPFEGRAFYHLAQDGRWIGRWFDNRGVSFPLDAAVAGRTLTTAWGSVETERGRTVYALGADGRLTITDSVGGADGSQSPFATHTLQRAE
ncbi:MAG: hypothetical protein ACXWUX_14740 [Allosphingosinicella sp.]